MAPPAVAAAPPRRFVAGHVALALAVAVAVAAAAAHAYLTQCPRLPELAGAVVLITGASSGIGAELAVQYGRLGATVVIAARRAAQLGATADAARAAGAKDVLAVPTDMTDAAACEALVAAAIAAYGRLDLLVLNHAAVDDALFASHADAAALDASLLAPFRTNVLGSAYTVRAALPTLEAAGGAIVIVSSASAKVAAPFHAGYVASKSALHGLFNTLRAELHLTRSSVAVQLQVLGMVGTAEVMRDPALAGLAAPVPGVAREMICAAQARWYEVYIPWWYGPWTLVTYIGGPDFAEWAMNNAYIFKVPRYVAAIERHAVRAGRV